MMWPSFNEKLWHPRFFPLQGVYFPPCFWILGSRYIYILNNVWLPGITLRDRHRFNFLKPAQWTFQHATVRCATKTPWSPFIPQFINHLARIKWNQSGVFLRWNHRSRTRDKCTSCFFPQRWLSSESRQTNIIVGTELVSMRNSGKRKFFFFNPPLPILSFYDHCLSLYLFKACRKYSLTLGVSGKRKRADVTSTQGQRGQGNRAPWFLNNSHNFEVCHILLCFLQLHC